MPTLSAGCEQGGEEGAKDSSEASRKYLVFATVVSSLILTGVGSVKGSYPDTCSSCCLDTLFNSHAIF
jgi:NADH:ubiquinone oxidoreductase subunit 2 (subunit N)